MHAMELKDPKFPPVNTCASLFQLMCYNNKDNLMADIYDQISDEDDEEEEKVNSDNPFQQQMMQEAKDLKVKQIEQRL